MHILYLEWNCYANQYVKKAWKDQGHFLHSFSFPANQDCKNNPELCEHLVNAILTSHVDCCFSINYFPIVAIACRACNVKYISWTYDSPYAYLYSDTILFETNYAFVFDRSEVSALNSLGAVNVYHLPMAVPAEGYRFPTNYDSKISQCSSGISMIGSMYSESKHRLINQLSGISDYSSGYIDALIKMQKYTYGVDIITNALSDLVLAELSQNAPLLHPEDELQSIAWVYSKYFICREITRLERYELLTMLSNNYNVYLYTHEKTPELTNINNLGPLDYYKEAPLAMKNSKINLNISLRSITSGIPLRVFDIMGAGGFIITNYQEELLERFTPDVDFVYFESPEDLLSKVNFYLIHDNVRNRIAKNGQIKVYGDHTYSHRIKEIERIIKK